MDKNIGRAKSGLARVGGLERNGEHSLREFSPGMAAKWDRYELVQRIGKKAITLPVFYMFLIFFLSSIPGDNSDALSGFLHQINPSLQNMLHVPLYMGLMTLWVLILPNFNLRWRRNLCLSFAISWVYSIVDELHQFYVPGRYPGLIDIILNTLGIMIAFLLFYWFFKHKNRHDEPTLSGTLQIQ